MSEFVVACKQGNLQEAQRLYGLGGVDIHADNESAFRWAWSPFVQRWLYFLDAPGHFNYDILTDRLPPLRYFLFTGRSDHPAMTDDDRATLVRWNAAFAHFQHRFCTRFWKPGGVKCKRGWQEIVAISRVCGDGGVICQKN